MGIPSKSSFFILVLLEISQKVTALIYTSFLGFFSSLRTFSGRQSDCPSDQRNVEGYQVNNSLKTYELFFSHFEIIGKMYGAFSIKNA